MNILSNKPASIGSPVADAAAPAASAAVVSYQRWIIFMLSAILVISLLGATNTFNLIGNILTNLIKYITDFATIISANLGYTTGTLVNTTTNVASNVAISSVEVADGAINSAGNIFRDATAPVVAPEIKKQMDKIVDESEDFLLLPRGRGAASAAAAGGTSTGDLRRDLDDVINRVKRMEHEAGEDSAQGVMQKRGGGAAAGGGVTVTKDSWCLVGSLGGKRSCINVQSGDKCGYARLYDDKLSCLEKTA
jgi:hypothetical protein